MSISLAVAIGSLFAALVPVYGMFLVFRRGIDHDREESLERENKRLARENRALHERNDELADENVRLMRRILEP